MDRQDWNERYRTGVRGGRTEPSPLVVAEAAALAPGRALDLAAGVGRHAVWLAEQGWRVTAVDYSDVAIGKARELAAGRGVAIETEVADVTTYRPAVGAYDLVLICYLQVPADDRKAAVAHAADALAPGGTLLMVSHDRSNHDGGWGGPSSPEVLATPDEVRALQEAVGLTVTRAEVVERAAETPEGQRVAFDHVVVGHRPPSATGAGG
ncbi:MAG: class I SAM-dependent methyltransferase [Acidimicrobiales bacterium]